MARLAINELKGRHAGEDIWVIASGPSAGHIAPAFFDNKVTVGVNRVWGRFRTTYVVLKHSSDLQDAIHSGATAIASKHNCGCLNLAESAAQGDWYAFEHPDNGLEAVDLDAIGTERIVVSFSTTTSAMHVAAYMGAANIILVGHDCGTLDGARNYPGYYGDGRGPLVDYDNFLARIEAQSIAVRDRLEAVYGCHIYSLNPFINLGLEGHNYARTSR